MQVSPMITVTRGRFGPAAAQVLEQVRAAGLANRDEIAARTGLSVPTVGRAVGLLVDAGVLRERTDRARSGKIGRPGIPVEVDTDRYATIGIHVGRRIATVALGDLTGRVIAHDIVHRVPGADPDLDSLSRAAARLLGSSPGRAPLAAGLVGPWRELGLDHDVLAAELHDLTGLDVRTGDHIAAVAATEFFHRRQGTPGVTLYVYARDTVGFAVAVEKGTATEVSRVGSLTHYPTGSAVPCPCGRTGCFEVTAAEPALVRRAADAGLLPASTARDVEALYDAAADPRVLALFQDRARVLGEVAASVRDMIRPDRVVLVGQAFTGCRAVLDDILRAFGSATALGEVPVSFTRFGDDIQAITACTIGLGPVYDDPIAMVPRRNRIAPTGP